MRGMPLLIALVIAGCASTTTVHTKPTGAEVYINGQRCGVSPCVYHTRYGFPDRMRVQLQKEGYESAEFFVDTEAPIASYLLYGFGSYVFHSFDEEYRFALSPLAPSVERRTKTTAAPTAGAPLPPPEAASAPAASDEVINQIEQCLYWGGEESSDPARRDFLARSAARDCPLAVDFARRALAAGEPRPPLAAALVRLIAHLGNAHGADALVPEDEIPQLCSVAVIEYARRFGADPEDRFFPYFEILCREQHGLLLEE